MKDTKQWLLVVLGMVLIFGVVTACGDPAPDPNPAAPATESETSGGDAEGTPADDAEAATPTPEPTPTATMEPVAAIVNGTPIPLASYEHQVSRYEASMVAAGEDLDKPEGQQAAAQGRQWVLDLMIEQVLIEQAAAEEGVTVTDDELQGTIDSLREEIGDDDFNAWLEKEGMSLEQMRERLRSDMIATKMANRIAEAVPQTTDHVHARHILLATREEAERILSQLEAGGDFATLAREYSNDVSTRDVGGDLGFFPPGVLTSDSVEAAAFALQPGQISGVVESELGFHVVQVVERTPDQEVSPENLRLLRDQAVRGWLDELRESADIQIFVEDF
jgi:parvulin-like peptidyl-prolyl isomerase